VRRAAGEDFVVRSPERRLERRARRPADLLADPATALVGALLETAAAESLEPLELDLFSGVPYGSGLGGSSALLVAMAGALARFGVPRPSGAAAVSVDFVRDVETRVLGKPAGVQDYYPPLFGGLQRIRFEAGATSAEREDVDPELWERHLTLFDSGASHSSGMNNWEIFRARMEGDGAVAKHLDGVRRAAADMAAAAAARDFEAMGRALGEEWDARRLLAPVVSTPALERAIAAARKAGAWAGKACGAGGGGCVVFLSPAEKTGAVRTALAGLGEGNVLPVRAENRGLEVE
jgi:D-glycero-alpha-D-manno-heptose-7-phosphate kinase